jgi:hypothetical protein
VRGSDYSIYEDPQGRFHIIPYDTNETFQAAEGLGRGGPRGGEPALGPGRRGPGFGDGGPFSGTAAEDGICLDPFTGTDDPNKPLLSKLLAVPALRQRYLEHMRKIAGEWLAWSRISPLAQQYQALIATDVRSDTRKLDSTEAFTSAVTNDRIEQQRGGPGGPPRVSLKSFVEKRQAYLLAHPEIKKSVLK